MSSFEFIFLGTASQTPTRTRTHNGYVLRLGDKLIMFDPGEGTQRQCTYAGISVAKLDAVCVTHFHGDHCLGLPGIIQRRSLDNQNFEPSQQKPLPIYYPGDGEQYLDALCSSSVFEDNSQLQRHPVSESAQLEPIAELLVAAKPLKHRTTTFGYTITEPDGFSFDKDALAKYQIAGPQVSQLKQDGFIKTDAGRVELEAVGKSVKGLKVAFVMDTALCDGAKELAQDADLLVCESTYLDSERELASKYKHMTAKQAGKLAAEAGVKLLALTHFSSRYETPEVLAVEARRYHPHVVAGQDLTAVSIHKNSFGELRNLHK